MKKKTLTEDYDEAEIEALKRVNRGEPLRDKKRIPSTAISHIKPLYHHPLPLSRHRYQHEQILREVLTHSVDRQALTAVTFQNPWVLEEIILRGAPIEIPDKNGSELLPHFSDHPFDQIHSPPHCL
jgi:hypothetical protein